MVLRKLQPALQQSEGRSKPWSGSRIVNGFSELAEGDKADQFAVMAIPGLRLFSDVSNDPVRGLHQTAQVLFAVIGTDFMQFDEFGNETIIGTIAGAGPVSMDDNGTEIAIVGGVNNDTGYVYSGGILHTGIVNLPQVSDVTFIDGYFVWTIYNSDQFIISGLNDGLSYDPLDVATAEGRPDRLVGCINDHRELHLPGQTSWEIWYNSGAADFPFSRQGNAFIERGCIDRNSLVKIDNSVHFVGDDRVVYRLNGYDPVRISTHAIEFKIDTGSWYRAFTYTQEGHKFYILSTDEVTSGYDMATGAWHERKSYGRDNYRIGHAETAFGTTIFGDAYTGRLTIPELDLYDELDDPMPMIIEIPSIENNRTLTTLYSVELYCETGIGNTNDPDPQAILQYSKDGGYVWSTELWRPMGAVGDYVRRVIWRIGVQFRSLQLRFTLPSKTRRMVMYYLADLR